MSEMIERAARAAFEACYDDTHTAGWDHGTGDVNASPELKDRFREIASAVIVAMRAPNPTMIKRACDIIVGEDNGHNLYCGEEEASEIWRAMIDAALADDKREPPKSVPSVIPTQARGASIS